jgi:effector-binding domain-containing protein
MVGKGMEMCMKWMQETGADPMGTAFSIYYEDPADTKAGDLTSKHGFPVGADSDPIEGVVIEEIPAAEVAAITYMGEYNEAGNAWSDLMTYIEAEGYVFAGPPMEVYLVSPNDTDKPEEWTTEIRWAVMKKESKEEGSEDGEATEKTEEAEAEGEE